MIKYTCLLILVLLSSCFNRHRVTKKDLVAVDTSSAEYKKIMQLVETADNKQPDSFGTLIANIPFTVRTPNLKDYPDGIIPFANIEKQEQKSFLNIF
jgi:hypothetical protein